MKDGKPESWEEVDEIKDLFLVAAICSVAAALLSMRLEMPPAAFRYFARQAGRFGTLGCSIALVQRARAKAAEDVAAGNDNAHKMHTHPKPDANE